MVDGGVATDGDFLTRAAELANKRWDGALADRLASSAIAGRRRAPRAAGARRRVLQARPVRRIAPALSAVDDAQLDDEELAHLAMLLAETGFWGLGRAAETNDALRRHRGTSARAPAPANGCARSSPRSCTPVNDRARAAEIALPIASDPEADGLARLRAATAAAGWLSFAGHPTGRARAVRGPPPRRFRARRRVATRRRLGRRADARRVQLPRAVRRGGAGRYGSCARRRSPMATTKWSAARRSCSRGSRSPEATCCRAFDGAGGDGRAARIRRGRLSALVSRTSSPRSPLNSGRGGRPRRDRGARRHGVGRARERLRGGDRSRLGSGRGR